MLTDKVRVERAGEALEPEDIFSDAASLFPDDTRNAHGDPDATILYSSKYGDLRLAVSKPEREEDRRLFAHYLWNASIYCAAMIEDGQWSVEDEATIELGAGLGLVGIVSALSGARQSVLTDYPTAELLGTISRNTDSNISDHTRSRVTVAGHTWGVFTDDFACSNAQNFEFVFATDCFWMPWAHQDLARSMLHFLSRQAHARVYAVAGFHTGRAKLAPFFDVAVEEGLEIEHIREVDVFGNTRPWLPVRDGGAENVTERKRWLVVAILKRAESRS